MKLIIHAKKNCPEKQGHRNGFTLKFLGFVFILSMPLRRYKIDYALTL